MGVYNPMAKMPRACGECEDRFKCQYSDTTIPRRSDDCPLIEVKAPHGRLIDAPEVKWTWFDDTGERSIDLETLSTAIKWLDDAPTLIEAEVE